MGKPAARLTDMHLCPRVNPGPVPHVGGPILPPCKPTVLIGSLPAARVGDKAFCIGPLDTVAQGSKTVLIGGKPAARMGDRTAHGGVIVKGCFTVLVGDGRSSGSGPAGAGFAALAGPLARALLLGALAGTPLICKDTCAGCGKTGCGPPPPPPPPEDCKLIPDKQDMLDKAQEGRALADAMEDGPEKDQVLAAAERLIRNAEAREKAELADDVYRLKGKGKAPEGWKRLNDEGGLHEDLVDDLPWEDGKGGYQAALYEHQDGRKVLVYRGTDNKKNKIADWTTNFKQTLGYQTDRYDNAVEIGQEVKEVYGEDFEITGHSLGGGLTSLVSSVTGVPGTTYNAAGVHSNTLKQHGVDRKRNHEMVTNYHVDGEVLTGAQRPGYNVVTTPVATAVRYRRQSAGLVNPKTKKLNLQPVWVYDAAGERHTLPAADEFGEEAGWFSAGPIDKHGMDYVKNGFNKEAREDMMIIDSNKPPPPPPEANPSTGGKP